MPRFTLFLSLSLSLSLSVLAEYKDRATWINGFEILSAAAERSLVAFIKSVNCEKEECVGILELFRRMKKHQADGIFRDAVPWTAALNKNSRELNIRKSAETTAQG